MTSIFTRTISDLFRTSENGRVSGYTVVAGGGFGMSHGKTETFPALAKPLFYVAREHVVAAAVAVVTAQRDFGNRADRKRARLKYLIDERGIDWFREEVIKRLDVPFEPAREVQWNTVSDVLRLARARGREIVLRYLGRRGQDQGHRRTPVADRVFGPSPSNLDFPFRLTTNCNIIFHDIDPAAKDKVTDILSAHGIPRPEDLTETRRLAQACVALPTCGLALAESERVFHLVLDKIDEILKDFGLAMNRS